MSASLDEPAADRELVLRRRIEAPRATVWRAWTDPAHLPRWWGPRGFSCDVRELDLREGGLWRFTFTGTDGRVFANRVRFDEIRPIERIALTTDDDGVGAIPPFRTLVTFEDQGDATDLTLRLRVATPEERLRMLRRGAVEGGSSTLDRLEDRVAQLDGRLVLTINRVIAAPRALVWDAWTRIEHARHWGPVGFTVIPEPGEVRAGAPWRARLVPADGGKVLWQGGHYLEVVPPERLVMTFAWEDESDLPMRLEVTLGEEPDGRTRLTLRQFGFVRESQRDGHGRGWSEALDALRAHLEYVAGGEPEAPAH